MEFWASAEVFQPAFPALDEMRRWAAPAINKALAESSLKSVKIELRYVPIVMPEGMRARYPARSKILKKDGICDCAPQLDYDGFVDGTFEEQLHEYLRGIALSTAHLADLGASKEQIAEFKAVLASVPERVLAEWPDHIRH